MSSSKSERIYIEKYQEKGFTVNFRVNKDVLVSDKEEKSYSPEDITIVAQNRFEGISNPSDLSILYAIETNDALQGTILVAYGTATNTEAAEFFKKVPEKNISNSKRIEI